MQFLVGAAAVVIIAVFAGPPLLMFALFAIGWSWVSLKSIGL